MRGVLTVGNDDRIAPFDRFVRDRFRQIDGQKHRVHLPSHGVEGGFEEHCQIIRTRLLVETRVV